MGPWAHGPRPVAHGRWAHGPRPMGPGRMGPLYGGIPALFVPLLFLGDDTFSLAEALLRIAASCSSSLGMIVPHAC